MKYKAKVYRDAIKVLPENGYSCHALDSVTDVTNYKHVYRFSNLFAGPNSKLWSFSFNKLYDNTEDLRYCINTKLGRRTREIALELAAHLEETGEMDKILKGK